MSSHDVENAKETVLSWIETAGTTQKLAFFKQVGKFMTLSEIKMAQNILGHAKRAEKKLAANVYEPKNPFLPTKSHILQNILSSRPTFSRDGSSSSQLNKTFDSKCLAKSDIPCSSRSNSTGGSGSGGTLSIKGSPHPSQDNRVRCPVKTCREMFDSYNAFSQHIQTVHTTWERKCLICGVKFEEVDKICYHLINMHGSSAAAEGDIDGRMVATESREDDEIDGETGIKIKQEVNDEMDDMKVEHDEEWGFISGVFRG